MAPWKAAVLALASFTLVKGLLPDGRLNANFPPVPAIPLVEVPDAGPIISKDGTVLPPYNTTYWFDMPIDHKNPSLGTFKVRYWHTYEFYESGGPIILMTPGEANAFPYADGYLTNRTINGRIAQQQNGSAIVLEHRYYGESNPFSDLSVKSLKYNTIQQALDDLEYFANNVVLPQPDGANVGPKKNPWIFIGGSYSGALAAWVMDNKPGLFFAAYSSSGVVEAIYDFWRYFEPVREHMPANCSADVQKAIKFVDKVFSGKNQTAIAALKDSFGLSALSHLDDAAGALRNNLWDWQSLQPRTGPGARFWQFCDALEVKDGVSAPASGWGTEHAVSAWAKHWKTSYLPTICGDLDLEECLGSYNGNSTFYTDTSLGNVWRSWFWTVCNEVGWLQDSPPPGTPSLVTQLVKPPYDMRQCKLMYPDAFKGVQAPPTPVWKTNLAYKGWKIKVDRLFVVNGQRDPWRDSTLSAKGVGVRSTPRQPIFLGEGFHCSDLSYANTLVNPNMDFIQTQALKTFAAWLKEWKPRQGSVHPGSPQRAPASVASGGSRDTTPAAGRNAWFRGSVKF